MAEGSGAGNDVPGEQQPEVRYLHPPIAPKPHVYNELLARLVGCRLHSVRFTSAYLQFSFACTESADVPVLTCEVMPTITTVAGVIADGTSGYADAIRSLIGDEVVETAEATRQGFRVGFAQQVLTLRPSADELTGPVIATLSDFADGSSTTWLPGGDAYEYLDQTTD